MQELSMVLIPADSRDLSGVTCRWRRRGAIGLLMLTAVLAACFETAFAEIVVLQSDGRLVTANRIGPETDDRRMALCVETEHVVLTRHLPWEQIRSVRIDAETFSSEVLRTYFSRKQTSSAATVRSRPRSEIVQAVRFDSGSRPDSRPHAFFSELAQRGSSQCDCQQRGPMKARIIGVRAGPLSAYQATAAKYFPHGVPLSEVGFALDLMRAKKVEEVFMPKHNARAEGDDPRQPNEEIPAERLPPLPDTSGPVKSIMVSAVPLSSHGRADWDALAVEVLGFDRFGRRVPLRGTLRVTLRGQSQQLVRAFGTRFLGDPGPNKTLATWSRSAGGADQRMILPLPRPLPEHDLRIAPYGQLHVRLLSPGRGVFEATSAVIPLRQVGALRDRSLMETGSRFFDDELTHDSRRPTGLRIVNPSAIRPNGHVLVTQ